MFNNVLKSLALLQLSWLLPMANVSVAADVSYSSLSPKVQQLEVELNGKIGISIYDTSNNSNWHYNGERRFPLMSTFKTLACAKLYSDVEKGAITLSHSNKVAETSLVTWSPVTKKLIGQPFTLKQSCAATMLMSDNTAANYILSAIGGPAALTEFMREIGDNVTRLDRIEPELNEATPGDIRDTTTPNAMVKSLHTLLFQNVLSPPSKKQLLQWMIDNKITGNLFRSVLPKSWKIADRSGSGGYGSRAINAIIWPNQDSALIISIYITQSNVSFAKQNQTIADIGKMIFSLHTAD